ncbi:MAG: serine/threonine protein kinase [Myxococcales bacterium]|nr:serine/threonine protein kinase [Myxococcales bacterium]
MAPSSPHASAPLPASIGPYRVLRRLGVGGMAEVFLAIAYGASGFEKQVAIKIPLPRVREDGRLLRLLIEEARLGARLQHRNLVQVHDLGVADGVYYVRMDYVDGADLHTLTRRERPSPGLALLIAEELALALEYVHDVRDDEGRPLGLVHRDVSPSNILLSRHGELKLADFGIAKATMLADNTLADGRRGKYAYMSPEQVERRSLTAQSDQFALGVTLVELLIGRRPFEGATPLATMENIRAAAPPPLPQLTPEVRAVALRCLSQRPEDRFPSAAELREALAACRRAYPASTSDLARWVRAHVGEPGLRRKPITETDQELR